MPSTRERRPRSSTSGWRPRGDSELFRQLWAGRASIAGMTGNEPGSTGSNQLDSEAEEARRQKHGSMREAEDDAARDVESERERAADAGDPGAEAEGGEKPDRVRRAAEWLDGVLAPGIGGADLGPYEEESEESVRSHDACPLCGHPMGEHAIDRSNANAVLICPVPPNPEVL